MAKKKVSKWFEAGKSLNWHKSDSQSRRRKNALASRKNDSLATARALQALANISQDSETRRKAASDARYFYRLNAKKKSKANKR